VTSGAGSVIGDVTSVGGSVATVITSGGGSVAGQGMSFIVVSHLF
jgi:hypothetical protein